MSTRTAKVKKEKTKEKKPKSTEPKKPEMRGRPTLFSQELADLICMRTATTTMGLQKMCNTYDDLPAKDTINQWRYKYPLFSAQYASAKMLQGELLAEEIIEIADDGQNDYMESLPESQQSEGWKLHGEHVQRSRLRVDTRKWLAAKLAPKIYGTQALEHKLKLESEVEKMLLSSE